MSNIPDDFEVMSSRDFRGGRSRGRARGRRHPHGESHRPAAKVPYRPKNTAMIEYRNMAGLVRSIDVPHQPVETLSNSVVQTIHEEASSAYPQEPFEVALRKRLFDHYEPMAGVFYQDEKQSLDDAPNRCIRIPDLRYVHPYGKIGNVVWISTRKFIIPRRPTLKNVDQPKPHKITQLVQHSSERDWNRPLDDRYHFLNLPVEIQKLIISFVVTLPQGEDSLSLAPRTLGSNWGTHWQHVGYELERDRLQDAKSEFLAPVAFIQQSDQLGSYCAVARVIKAPIDATICRLSPFNQVANQMLYANNTFHFSMNGPHQEQCLPNLLRDKTTVYQPCPIKPAVGLLYWPDSKTLWGNDQPGVVVEDEDMLNNIIAEAVQEVKHPRTLDVNGKDTVPDLPGWQYYDHFMHFLWTIGPKNAALIRSVEFEGSLKRHEGCSNRTCRRSCGDDIAECIELYIPFMVACLPNLEKLTIKASDDVWRETGDQMIVTPPDDEIEPSDLEIALRPILEEKLRALPNLRILKFERREWYDDDGSERYLWLDEAIEFFRRRGIHQDSKKRRQEAEANLVKSVNSLTV